MSWGVALAGNAGNPSWQRVLSELSSSGLTALELGPVGYLPEDSYVAREALEARRLTAVGSFLFESLHDPSCRDHVLAVAKRACRAIAGVGGRLLVIIDRPGRERAATAGRSDAARRLSTPRWLILLDTINAVAEIAHECSLQPCFHPHAGSFVEFRDEIDRLLADTDLPLCLDTGHAAFADIEPEHALRAYAPRLRHVHLKDVDGAVCHRVKHHRLGYWAALSAGIFSPLGCGIVGVERVLTTLDEIAYTGIATIEQDRAAGMGTPLADLRHSLAFLRGAGLAVPAEKPLN